MQYCYRVHFQVPEFQCKETHLCIIEALSPIAYIPVEQ